MPILNFLVVEDEPANRQLVRALLMHLGHHALEASNGIEALRMLEATAGIDAVLLDLHMELMDGFSLLAQLRDRPETRHLPVICVSALARQEDRDQAMGAGADGYVVKPFRRRDLIAAIDAVLARTGAIPAGSSIASS